MEAEESLDSTAGEVLLTSVEEYELAERLSDDDVDVLLDSKKGILLDSENTELKGLVVG